MNKYAIKSNRQDYYFFPWNEDKYKILNIFYEKWRYIKYISGLDKKAFEKNTPKNGVVDRLLIRRYPHNTGFLETHVDIDVNVRIVSGVFMSKKEPKVIAKKLGEARYLSYIYEVNMMIYLHSINK